MNARSASFLKMYNIDDESLKQFMAAADQLSNAVYSIELKRQKRERKVKKLVI